MVLRQLLCGARKPAKSNVGVGEGDGGELDGALDAVQAGSLCQIRSRKLRPWGGLLPEPPGAGAGGGTLLAACAWAAAVGKLTAREVRATEAFGPGVAEATAEAGAEEDSVAGVVAALRLAPLGAARMRMKSSTSPVANPAARLVMEASRLRPAGSTAPASRRVAWASQEGASLGCAAIANIELTCCL